MPKIIYASDMRKISSDKFGREVGEISLTGKDGVTEKLKRESLRNHTLKLLHGGKTGTTVEEYLKKAGVVGRQEEKRKKLLTLIKGGRTESDRPTAAMIREAKLKKRANVKGGQMSRNMAEDMEMKRRNKGDKNSRIENRLNRSLEGVDEQGRKVKTSFANLNVKQKEYKVTTLGGAEAKRSLTSSLESKSHLTFAGQSNDGGIASIDSRAKNATSITGGVGVIKKLNNPGLGGGMGGNGSGHIPLSKAA